MGAKKVKVNRATSAFWPEKSKSAILFDTDDVVAFDYRGELIVGVVRSIFCAKTYFAEVEYYSAIFGTFWYIVDFDKLTKIGEL